MNLEQFTHSIQNHGHAITLTIFKNGMDTILIPHYKMINELDGSLSEYLHKIIDNFQPQTIVVSCKKKTGTSYAKEKTFIHHVPESNSLGGVPSQPSPTRSNSLDNQQVRYYERQIDDLTNKLQKAENKLDATMDKLDETKETLNETRRELDTTEQRHSLELQKKQIANENSLASIIKEMKPELSALLLKKNATEAPAQNQQQLAGINPQSKTGIILSIMNSLQDPADFNQFYETIVRFGQMEPDKRIELLKQIQQDTTDFNFQEYNNYPQK